jgi:protoheme IX farnesyltransferase
MLNQLFEHRRDALMHRTRARPIPSGRVRRVPVFVAGVLLAYAGTAILALAVNVPSAALALVNVLLYALVYTPLKPLTTMNTLVGAVTGAIPPMLGWAAATGGLESGAWILGAILFVWQLPHFLALAWIYREDYRRGGHSMLPVVDPSGELTARTMVGTSLLLVPLGFALTVMGAVGWFAAFANVPLALAMAYLSIRFYADRSDRRARAVFLASIVYLPLVLAVMTLDRGPVDAESWLRGGREPFGVPLPVEP